MSAAPEFSRPLELDEIGRDVLRRELEASSGECAALARRFGLLAIDHLSASLNIRKSRDGRTVAVEGVFSAKVTQECIVTLDPVEAAVSGQLNEKFVREEEEISEAVILPDDDESYDERIEGETIDIGEMVSQCLLLALDPYPRKDGVEFESEATESDAAGKQGPFAKLAELKENDS